MTNRGPDPYWATWTFDATGSRTSQVVHSASGGADATTTYTYPAPGAVRPHTLSSTSGPGGTKTYGYDNAGNTTSRPGPTGQQTLTWDAEGNLATVTGGSSYLYDADGQRLIARDPGVTTLYLPAMELRLTGTVVTATRYYATAVCTAAGGLTWLASDHHGTNQLAVNAATLTVTRRKSLPYGETRGTPPGSWPDQKGLVGGTQDPTALTHLGAREYDPATGRFLSVDPVIDPSQPQQMHGYAYANNNPTTLSDPSGLAPPVCLEECGSADDRAYQERVREERRKRLAEPQQPDKPDPPTVEDVLDKIVRHGSGGEHDDLEDFLDALCRNLGAAACKAVKQAFNQIIPRIAEEPFNCNLFPYAEQCHTNFDEWMRTAYEHIEVTIGACEGVCVNLEFQGGNLHIVAGVGTGAPGVSGAILWHTETYDNQETIGVTGCATYYAGVCGGYAPKVDPTTGEWTGYNWTGGIAFGKPGVALNVGYTVANYNFHQRKWTGPQNPLPPSLQRKINRAVAGACGASWWC